MKRSGPLRRRTPLQRSPLRRSAPRGLPSSLRSQLAARSGGRCEAQFSPQCLGAASQAHHRRRRSQGGADELDNLVHCCLRCHHDIHANPQRAAEAGLLQLRRLP